MLIFLTRLISLILALFVGLITAVMLSIPFVFVLTLGWDFWGWPYKDVFVSYPVELWVLGIYGAGVLILQIVPALREMFMDMALGHRRLSKREKVSAAAMEDELAWRCRSRNLKMPKIIWRVAIETQVNGYTYGRNRIALTQRLMITHREGSEKWKGGVVAVAAHELGHIYHGDGFFYLWFNMLSWPAALLLRFLWVFTHVHISFLILRRLIIPVSFVATVLHFLVKLLRDIALLPHMLTSKLREYRADKFAYRIGLGREQIFILEHLLRRENVQNKGLKKLIDTHPPIEFRIEALERLIEINKNRPVSQSAT